MIVRFRVAIYLLLVWAVTAMAGELPSYVVKYTTTPPAIDGVLSDKCWEQANCINGLHPAIKKTYQDRIDKIPTRIKLLWDDENLYVSFYCYDDEVFTTGKLKHDDNIYTEDACEIFIDTIGDGRQWIEIQVSPLNQTLDLIHFYLGDTADVTPTGRLSAESVKSNRWLFREWEASNFKSAVSVIKSDGKPVGWIVEMAIAAKDITRRMGGGQLKPSTIRANFVRYDHPVTAEGKRNVLFMSWSAVEFGCPHISPGKMGFLNLQK